MKKVIWLLLVLFLTVPVYAADFEGVEIDLKEVEAQIKRVDIGGGENLFVGWTDDQVRDFIEATSLIQRDMEVTQITINKYGHYVEANAINRQLYASGISPESTLLPTTLAYYLILNELSKKERTIALFLLRILEVYCIDTHKFYYGYTPSGNQVPVVTIVRLKF